MKYLILSIDATAFKLQKGHRNALEFIAIEVAKFNSQSETVKDKTKDDFIKDLFTSINTNHIGKIELTATDKETTYRFGFHKSKKEYVHYGEITKTVLI